MKSALIVVDVQLDFCEGGALAVPGGNRVAHDIAELIRDEGDRYELITFTQDDHLSLEFDPTGNCGHFAIPPAEPDYIDTWPVHCVRGTPGALLHAAISGSLLSLPPERRLRVQKGQGVAAYSAFDGSVTDGLYAGASLASVLLARDIGHAVVVGLAYDYCVAHTAQDAVRLGLPLTSVSTYFTASVHPDRDMLTATMLRDFGVVVTVG